MFYLLGDDTFPLDNFYKSTVLILGEATWIPNVLGPFYLVYAVCVVFFFLNVIASFIFMFRHEALWDDTYTLLISPFPCLVLSIAFGKAKCRFHLSYGLHPPDKISISLLIKSCLSTFPFLCETSRQTCVREKHEALYIRTSPAVCLSPRPFPSCSSAPPLYPPFPSSPTLRTRPGARCRPCGIPPSPDPRLARSAASARCPGPVRDGCETRLSGPGQGRKSGSVCVGVMNRIYWV